MDKWQTVAIAFLLAGGLGNLIDRVLFGTVTDFLNFGIGELRTGILNIADLTIVFAVLLLIFSDRLRSPKVQST